MTLISGVGMFGTLTSLPGMRGTLGTDGLGTGTFGTGTSGTSGVGTSIFITKNKIGDVTPLVIVKSIGRGELRAVMLEFKQFK